MHISLYYLHSHIHNLRNFVGDVSMTHSVAQKPKGKNVSKELNGQIEELERA